MPVAMGKSRGSCWVTSMSAALIAAASAAKAQPTAAGIQDNSFFIEEAYNQEAGVVQHIFAAPWSSATSGHDRQWALNFTQEWPVVSQTHQFSYTVPYTLVHDPQGDTEGLGDIQLNYRLQALGETDSRPAFAPRFSLILPTGDEKKGLGIGTTGCQINLPISKIVSDRWTLHGNAGMTVFPDASDHTLTSYNLGASAIYAVSRDFNLMLECLGTWDEELAEADKTTRSFNAIVSPGARYAVNFRDDAQLVLGLAFPIGVSADAPDYGVFLYLSFEHRFAR